MTLHSSDKINPLVANTPEGVAMPMSWLSGQGYSRQLVNSYIKGGWLVSLGHGVYCKPGKKLDWQGAVLGVQHFLKLPVHVGGITALNSHGLAQYLPISTKESVHLWGAKVPAWLNKLELKGQFKTHHQVLFAPDEKLAVEKMSVPVRDWTLWVSSPERAILEVLSDVKSEDDFVLAAELFTGMTHLRPNFLNPLLMCCKNIKVKRLFLFLADHYQQAWFKRLDLTQVDLGKGKRQVVKGGAYNSQYQITVPRQFCKSVDSDVNPALN